MTDEEFCVKCGVKLSKDAYFCPSCGYHVPGKEEAEKAAERNYLINMFQSHAKWAGYLMLIYGIPLLILGLYYLFDSNGIANSLWNDSNIHQQLVDWGITYDELVKYLQYWGAGWLISGVAGILSAVLCIKRRSYILALILSMISVVFAITGFITFLIGLIAFWLVASSKLGFEEYKDDLEEFLKDQTEKQ